MTFLACPGTSGTPALSGREGFMFSKCQAQGVLRHGGTGTFSPPRTPSFSRQQCVPCH